MNKHKKIKIIMGIFACVVAVFIIHYVTAKPIPKPDKIIVYHNGNQTEIVKNNPSYNKIVNYMSSRIAFNSSLAQLGIPENWEDKIKNDELGVEFIYSSKQTFRLKDRVRPFPYTRLFFPIKSSDKYNEDLMFFSIKDENFNGYYNGPISLSPCSSELLNLLKTFK